MSADREPSSSPSISDAAVQAATGKTWTDWFAALDAAGAEQMPHAEIARHVQQEFAASGWWSQMVTVEYERARGLRRKNQNADGFSVSASKVFSMPIDRLYEAWVVDDIRRRWLPEPVVVGKTTHNKSLRITWADGETRVDVDLSEKGTNRSQARVQHKKLRSPCHVEEMRAHWKSALQSLADALVRA